MTPDFLIQLDAIDRQIYKAFHSAWSQLDDPLPASLVAKINQIYKDLERNCADSVSTLEDIAYEYNPLKELYEKNCINLQKEYQPQELVRREKAVNLNSLLKNLDDNVMGSSLTSHDSSEKVKKKDKDQERGN